jgi:hypothetical protein
VGKPVTGADRERKAKPLKLRPPRYPDFFLRGFPEYATKVGVTETKTEKKKRIDFSEDLPRNASQSDAKGGKKSGRFSSAGAGHFRRLL